MPYQLAVLDFDGVILNSEPYHFYIRESLLAAYCAGAQYDPVDCVGKSVPEFYAEMLRRSGADSDIPERAKQLAEMHFELVFESIRDNHVAANPGVEDFLRQVREAGLKTAVASSSSGAYVGKCLDYLGLCTAFDWVCCGESVKKAKPAPDVYELALSLASCLPRDAFAVEDSRSGAAAAAKAGIICFGYSQKTDAANVPGTFATVHSFGELLGILQICNTEAEHGKKQ